MRGRGLMLGVEVSNNMFAKVQHHTDTFLNWQIIMIMITMIIMIMIITIIRFITAIILIITSIIVIINITITITVATVLYQRL
jgi:ABC-type transport system involved in cytochrome bd biosynthesis fused ATPase/permease subunit